MNEPLTPCIDYGGWCAKRDDLACCSDPERYPGGSKVRQYAWMISRSPASAPMVVGCSADSAMQIYVAAASDLSGRPGIVYTAKRRQRSAATQYAARAQGVELHEVAPGYLSQCRSQARKRGAELEAVVRWDAAGAIEDAAEQVVNLPAEAKRVLVATGSGLTAVGVLVGLARAGRSDVAVLAVAVSGMASAAAIESRAAGLVQLPLPPVALVRVPQAYGDAVYAALPDGTLLDPYYAAKCLAYVQPGDCFWIPGIRPRAAMPAWVRSAHDRAAVA